MKSKISLNFPEFYVFGLSYLFTNYQLPTLPKMTSDTPYARTTSIGMTQTWPWSCITFQLSTKKKKHSRLGLELGLAYLHICKGRQTLELRFIHISNVSPKISTCISFFFVQQKE